MKNISLVLIFLQLLIFNNLYPISFTTIINTDNGISSRIVMQSAKDSDGYLWFATRMGLDKYNGESTTHYKLNTSSKENIKSILSINHPKGITTNTKKEIYTFTSTHIFKFDPISNDFIIAHDLNLPNDCVIVTISFDCFDNIWIGTNNALYLIKYNSDEIIKIIDSIQIYNVIFKQDGTQGWVATSRGIINIERDFGDKYILRNDDILPLSMKRIQSLYFDELTNQLWIGTFSSGVYNYDLKSKKLDHYNITNKHVRSITHIDHNKIWIGTDGDGIFEYNRFNLELIQTYSQNAPEQYKLPTNSIYDIKDYGNFIAICTYKSGVIMYNKNSIVNTVYKHIEDSKNSLLNHHVNVVLVDKRDRIWFGTDDGISRYDKRKDKWKHFLQADGKNSNVILTLMESSNGDIWAGGYSCDIAIINQEDEVSIPSLPLNESMSRKDKYVYHITKDRKGDIWIGGVVNDLIRFSQKNRELKNYSINNVNYILPLDNGLIALATPNGVKLLDENSGKISHLNAENEYLSHPSIQCLSLSSDNKTLWIGTEGLGVLAYNMNTKDLKIYSQTEGLSSNNICSILNDSDEKIWITTISGLNCIDLPSNKIYSFSNRDGLPSNTFTLRSNALLDNGNIILGTPNGAFEFNARINQSNIISDANLRFQEFALFNKPIYPNSTGSPLKNNIDKDNKIKLSYKQHSFSFKFINLASINEGKSTYSWKLDGFDRGWSTPSYNNNALYTNIPPGKYKFYVRCFIGSTDTPIQERSIEILVKAPWWDQWYSWLAYLIILALIGYAILRIQIERFNARNADQKVRFFINVAHDIRTPLTLIKAPLSEIETESLSCNGRKALNIANNNTNKLLDTVNQLLNFQKLERNAMVLQVERTLLYDFIDNTILNFEPLANKKQLKINKEFSIDSNLYGYIDNYKVSVILDNLISNAIKYTQPNGVISIKGYIKEELLCIDISDNGIGIAQNEQKYIFNRFYRTKNAANSTTMGSGIGLLLTKKMTLLHKGKIDFTSKEKIGSTFFIQIPINHDEYSVNEITLSKTLDNIVEEVEIIDKISDKIKLHIVEDNHEIRDYLRTILSSHYSVTESANAIEATGHINQIHPDFIISDVVMPGKSGIELCKTLKSKIDTCHIPIILLTSLTEKEDIIKGLEAGADDYFTKPFDPIVLKSKIATIINNRALYRNKFIDKSAFCDNTINVNELDKTFMKSIIAHIEEHMMNRQYSIDMLALDMAMSRSVLFKKIKSLTSQAPHEFITDLRMKRAANLLIEKKHSIGEISYLTGFANSKYFSTAFKKYFGTSPSEYVA